MDDPAVYAQIGEGDTVGLFQVESRAQMQTLPRLRPRRFYDLVVQVALIRPGPIQGEMVHPYIRRRRGEEPVTYLHPNLEPVLARTLGVPLFQEQGMKVAVVMAGFSPAQADRLRKLMGFKRAHDLVESSLRDLWDGMMARGVDEAAALRIVHQLEGFASYGFPESHAASFALLTYASAYLRHHFHPEYLAAMLNAQPMGFYAPSTLVEDARRHGVEVRPVDLLFSGWETGLEYESAQPAVRLGLRQVRGLSTASRDGLKAALHAGPLASLDDLVARADQVGLPDHVLVTLARAGAFRTLWPGRREALWEVLRRLRERRLSLDLRTPEHDPVRLPSMSALETTRADYATLGLSHEHHPMAFHRAALTARGVLGSSALRGVPHGRRVRVAGIVTCRQRPGSARGVLFMTLEDEDGMVNVVVMPDVFQRNRLLLATTPALEVTGTLEHQQGVLNVLGAGFVPLREVSAPTRSRSFR
jgi:error-prone DNA polymerase